MKLKFFILITVINSFMFQNYKDTDCYTEAGHSAQECKKFTTFVNNDPSPIEENVLYLCCYVDSEDYKGCKPVKEDDAFNNNKNINFDCHSLIYKMKYFFLIINLLYIF